MPLAHSDIWRSSSWIISEHTERGVSHLGAHTEAREPRVFIHEIIKDDEAEAKGEAKAETERD